MSVWLWYPSKVQRRLTSRACCSVRGATRVNSCIWCFKTPAPTPGLRCQFDPGLLFILGVTLPQEHPPSSSLFFSPPLFYLLQTSVLSPLLCVASAEFDGSSHRFPQALGLPSRYTHGFLPCEESLSSSVSRISPLALPSIQCDHWSSQSQWQNVFSSYGCCIFRKGKEKGILRDFDCCGCGEFFCTGLQY